MASEVGFSPFAGGISGGSDTGLLSVFGEGDAPAKAGGSAPESKAGPAPFAESKRSKPIEFKALGAGAADYVEEQRAKEEREKFLGLDDKRESDLANLYVPPITITDGLNRLQAQQSAENLKLARGAATLQGFAELSGSFLRTVTGGQPVRASLYDAFG